MAHTARKWAVEQGFSPVDVKRENSVYQLEALHMVGTQGRVVPHAWPFIAP
jgi:hypothetical protein